MDSDFGAIYYVVFRFAEEGNWKEGMRRMPSAWNRLRREEF
jgi:hypothetical protein